MSLQAQIEAINNPQEFTRLYNAVLDMKYGLDFIPIDDDQADGGNDGYVKSEKRIFAGHCFKRIQKQKIREEIQDKMSSDLAKAVHLRDKGKWEIEAWTFLSNYPIPEEVATEIVKQGKKAGIDVSWRGADYFANALEKFKEIREQFPNLIATDIQASLDVILNNLTKPKDDNKPITQVPLTQIEQERLIVEKPEYWPYLYFGSILTMDKVRLEEKWLNHKANYARPSGVGYDQKEARQQLTIIFPQLMKAIDGLADLINENAQAAFVDGDPVMVRFIANRILSAYEDMLDWASRLRSATYPHDYDKVVSAAAHMVDEPLQNIRDFIDLVHNEGNKIHPYITGPNKDEDLEVHLTLKFGINDTNTDIFNHELRKLQEKLGIY